MHSNNFGTNQGQSQGHRASMQPTYQSADMFNAQYSVQVNSPINPNQSGKGQNFSENNFLNVSKMPEGENRTMYNTGASFAKSSGNFGLSSFARQVDEPVQQKDKSEKNNLQTVSNNDKFGSYPNKPYGNPARDQKMAASAIFPTSTSNQMEFNRFPAFNLGWNQNNDQSSQSSTTSTSQTTGSKLNQSAKQKRQRELMEIKKQLDELNKKMMMNADKNKGNIKPNQPQQELRPPRNAGVSQSAIFDQYSSPGNNFGMNQVSQSKQQTSGLSIEQLYAQKKQNNEPKMNKQAEISYNQQKQNYNYGVTHPSPYEAEKKVEDNSYKQNFGQNSASNTGYKNDKSGMSQDTANFLQKYQFSSYKPSENNSYGNYKTENTGNSNTYGAQNQTKKTDNYSYSNNYPTTQNDKSTNNYPSKPESQAYTPLQPVQPLTENKPPIYNFSKPTESSAQVAGGFKKKKGPVAQIIEAKNQPIQMKQTMYPDTSTSTGYNIHRPSIKKTQSVNYNDPTIPLPELKQFKMSDFMVGKKMGKGQFGQVLLVVHKETGWLCGLKVMNKKDIKDQDYVGQIARELSIQFYLMHRNIAQLFGYFQDQKNFYLLIEFCTGGQLLQKLKEERRMNERDVSLIIRQVCEGVDYIHKQQIIHRDIKPENILFNYGVVKISDFGWAVYRGFGMRKTASGSPLYYPPEIVKGEAYDDKIDVWCIGMMTYECILGKIPFKVYTEMDLGRIVSDEITFPSWVDVTDQAKDFILKTLKKKGDERMQLKQMLRHPFITKHQQKQLSTSILEQFKRVLS